MYIIHSALLSHQSTRWTHDSVRFLACWWCSCPKYVLIPLKLYRPLGIVFLNRSILFQVPVPQLWQNCHRCCQMLMVSYFIQYVLLHKCHLLFLSANLIPDRLRQPQSQAGHVFQSSSTAFEIPNASPLARSVVVETMPPAQRPVVVASGNLLTSEDARFFTTCTALMCLLQTSRPWWKPCELSERLTTGWQNQAVELFTCSRNRLLLLGMTSKLKLVWCSTNFFCFGCAVPLFPFMFGYILMLVSICICLLSFSVITCLYAKSGFHGSLIIYRTSDNTVHTN